MITKIAAVVVFVISAIHFAGWLAGVDPEPMQSVVIIEE